MSTQAEVEWDETEQEWMLELHRFRESLCALCGGPSSECQSPEMENGYTVPAPTRCHRKTALDRAQEKYQNAATPGALLWGTVDRRKTR